jgi:AcrR family transcriptional regulator
MGEPTERRIHIHGDIIDEPLRPYNDTPDITNMRYVNAVARTPDPQRRPALMAAIVDYLIDKPLSDVTFRTLADGIGISTYTLIYHFGNREGLLKAIVQSVSERRTIVIAATDGDPFAVHLVNLRESWRLSVRPRNRELQRLEFEAALLEAREARIGTVTQGIHDRWLQSGVRALERLGIPTDIAETEARVLVGTMYGLHYDLLVTHDEKRVNEAFDSAIRQYEKRVAILRAEH